MQRRGPDDVASAIGRSGVPELAGGQVWDALRAVVESPDSAWWSDPFDAAGQSLTTILGSPRPVATAPRDVLLQWRRAAAEQESRGRPTSCM
ncbi:hypothetical protein [Tessaracoccus sp. Y1736]